MTHEELAAELKRRAWQLVRTDGEKRDSQASVIDAGVGDVGVELAYNLQGTEFFEVTLWDDRMNKRIYREINGDPGVVGPTWMLQRAVETLRRHQVLDDLANA